MTHEAQNDAIHKAFVEGVRAAVRSIEYSERGKIDLIPSERMVADILREKGWSQESINHWMEATSEKPKTWS